MFHIPGLLSKTFRTKGFKIQFQTNKNLALVRHTPGHDEPMIHLSRILAEF